MPAARFERLLCVVMLVACSCGDDGDADQFPCGNGTCDRGSEICIVGGPDRCTTCVSAPAAYVADPTCESLPPASDSTFGESQCVDDGDCELIDGEAVITCTEIEWGCG